jgi:DNA-binding response OmpR family regulator
MPNVLIVEDDIQLNLAIVEFFQTENYEVLSAYDGLEAVDMIDKRLEIDLFVIDINIPYINGLDLLKHLRTLYINTPVIIITASLEIENFINAFELGCTEYIKKPFHLKELEIRVANILSKEKNSHLVSINKTITLNTNDNILQCDTHNIVLRHKEKRFLQMLAQAKGRTVSYEALQAYIWEDQERSSYGLRQLVAELRAKIPCELIVTRYKEGYAINPTA